MKVKNLIFLICLCPIFGFGQLESKIDSMSFIDEMPYICRSSFNQIDSFGFGCGSKIFWEIVMFKEEAIPLLIEKLDDSTRTKAIVPNFGYNYTVADIALTALQEIVQDLPRDSLMQIKFDENCGTCSYWNHLNTNFQNRQKFKIEVQKWYTLNKHLLVWKESNSFTSCDCVFQHPNKGHFVLKK